MPRPPRTRWIDDGLTALGSGGQDAVRIERLAQALGVTKGGSYGYFADRAALLKEMLGTWERVVLDEAERRAMVGVERAAVEAVRDEGVFG